MDDGWGAGAMVQGLQIGPGIQLHVRIEVWGRYDTNTAFRSPRALIGLATRSMAWAPVEEVQAADRPMLAWLPCFHNSAAQQSTALEDISFRGLFPVP